MSGNSEDEDSKAKEQLLEVAIPGNSVVTKSEIKGRDRDDE